MSLWWSLVSKDVKINTHFASKITCQFSVWILQLKHVCQLKFGISYHSSGRMLRSKHDFDSQSLESSVNGHFGCCDGNMTCHLSVRMLRSKHDLSVKILSHMSVVNNFFLTNYMYYQYLIKQMSDEIKANQQLRNIVYHS